MPRSPLPVVADSCSSPLVVFVDADRHLDASLRAQFAEQGVRVAESRWGLAAYETTLRLLPDVVLLGPANEHTGVVLLIEQFRFDPATRHIPVVVLTPSRSRVFVDHLLTAGASEIVRAPTAPAHVFDVVHRWCHVSPAIRALRDLRRRVIGAREAAIAQRARTMDLQARILELRARLQETKMAMIAADSSGDCVAVNVAACTITGHVRDGLVGRKVWDFGPPAERPELQARWTAFLENGMFQGPCTLVRGDGAELTVDISASTHILPGLHVAALEPLA